MQDMAGESKNDRNDRGSLFLLVEDTMLTYVTCFSRHSVEYIIKAGTLATILETHNSHWPT